MNAVAKMVKIRIRGRRVCCTCRPLCRVEGGSHASVTMEHRNRGICDCGTPKVRVRRVGKKDIFQSKHDFREVDVNCLRYLCKETLRFAKPLLVTASHDHRDTYTTKTPSQLAHLLVIIKDLHRVVQNRLHNPCLPPCVLDILRRSICPWCARA